MTADEIMDCGIPVDDVSASAILTVESALEYVRANTNLEFDLNDIDSIKALPSCVKLFVVKYNELISRETGIASESIAGMSQSFETGDKDALLYSLLSSLCGQYVNAAQFECVPRIGRYVNGR
ncbi:MAG: hypothetical protein Q4G33_03935 [bacterium]|nr:hypothetical protein [bacterium]